MRLRSVALLLVLLSQFITGTGFVSAGYAAGGQEQLVTRSQADDSTRSLDVPFSQMKFTGKTFNGVYDNTEVWFRMPVEWKLLGGSQITLIYSVRIAETAQNLPAGGNYGTVYVTMNYVRIAVIPITASGDYRIEIPVSLATTPQLNTGYNVVGLTYVNELRCEDENGVSVFIDPNSFLTLTYVIQTTAPRLSNLPGPFLLPGLVTPASIPVMVVPLLPTDKDLAAALTVAASMGSMAQGEGKIQLIRADELTDEMKKQSNLILVGVGSALPLLEDLDLLAPIRAGAFANGQMISPEDGVIQIVNSPWNKSLAVLIISGDTGDAVIRAAQELRTEPKVLSGYQGLAVIRAEGAQVSAEAGSASEPAAIQSEARSFADLGYQDVTMTGVGTLMADYSFIMPNGSIPERGVTLDLVLNTSAGLDPDRTMMTVRLNDFPVYSIRLGSQESGDRKIHFEIDPSIILEGRNVLSVEVTIHPLNICDNRMDQYGGWKDDTLWTVIVRDTSSLIIPFSTGIQTTDEPEQQKSLSLFPDAFINSSSLDHLTFLVARDDLDGWNTAVEMAFSLGATSNFTKAEKSSVRLQAAFLDGSGNTVQLVGQNVIAVGTNTELEQYIPAGHDQIQQYDAPVVFDVLDGAPLGFVDIIPSVWDKDYSMLLVRGNNANGMDLAVQALETGGDGFLTGSSLVTNGSQVFFTQP